MSPTPLFEGSSPSIPYHSPTNPESHKRILLLVFQIDGMLGEFHPAA